MKSRWRYLVDLRQHRSASPDLAGALFGEVPSCGVVEDFMVSTLRTTWASAASFVEAWKVGEGLWSADDETRSFHSIGGHLEDGGHLRTVKDLRRDSLGGNLCPI